MIVGIDCYHDTTAGKRSIGALVASLNQGMSRYLKLGLFFFLLAFGGENIANFFGLV